MKYKNLYSLTMSRSTLYVFTKSFCKLRPDRESVTILRSWVTYNAIPYPFFYTNSRIKYFTNVKIYIKKKK